MLETLQKISPTDEVKMDNTRRQSADKTEETNLNNSDIGWLAGMWDGEGSVGMHQHTKQKGRRVPRSSVVNTDFAIIEECSRILKDMGVGNFVQTRYLPQKEHATRKDLTITGMKRNKIFLESIIPYLRGYKKIKAMLIMSFIYSRMMKPGSGRMRGGVPLDAFEESCIQKVANDFNGNLNEFTLEWIDNIHKMYSELRRQYEEATEMIARPQGSK